MWMLMLKPLMQSPKTPCSVVALLHGKFLLSGKFLRRPRINGSRRTDFGRKFLISGKNSDIRPDFERRFFISGRKSDRISYWWNPGKLVGNIFYMLEKICRMSSEINTFVRKNSGI
jgi:hypothetical protein